MDFSSQLSEIAGNVSAKLKAAGKSLCSKRCLTIIREAIAEAVGIAKATEAAPGDKRLFLERAGATAFDGIWAIPFPWPLNMLQNGWLTKKYVRPNALWAIDLFVDDGFAALGLMTAASSSAPAADPPITTK
jgi:hypothetical protein